MEKDLQTEYQAMIRAEVPDLWSRIESKIDAQEAQKIREFPAAVTESGSVILPVKKKKPIRWQYIALPAAAVLCAAIILPVMLHTKNMGAATTAPAANYTSTVATAGEACDEAVAETAACAEETDSMDSEAFYSDRKKDANQGATLNVDGNNALSLITGTSDQRELETPATEGCTEETEAFYEEAEADEEISGGIILRITLTEELTRDSLSELAKVCELTTLSVTEENGVCEMKLPLSADPIRLATFKEEIEARGGVVTTIR